MVMVVPRDIGEVEALDAEIGKTSQMLTIQTDSGMRVQASKLLV
jgi:hypothetical protein